MSKDNVIRMPSSHPPPISADPAADKGTCARPSGLWFWRKAEHRWTRWKLESTVNVYVDPDAQYPNYFKEVWRRECVLCGEPEVEIKKI